MMRQFFYLRSQIINALPIHKVFGLQKTNLDISDFEMYKALKSPQNTSNVTEMNSQLLK